MGTAAFGPEGKVSRVRGRILCDHLQEEAFAGTARRKQFRTGKVGGEGSPRRSLTWGCGWVNKQRGGWKLLLGAVSPEPELGDQGMPRQCTGRPRRGEAVAGGRELVSLPFSGFPGKSLGKGWAVEGSEGGVDEISIIALKCSQDEPFPMVSRESASFRNSICEGCGGESVGW